jgi:hypothetical protein
MYARVLALAGLVASASAFAPAALPTRAPRKFCAVAIACCEELWQGCTPAAFARYEGLSRGVRLRPA